MTQKAHFRRIAKIARQNIPALQRHEYDKAIAHKFLSLEVTSIAKTVALYASCKGEVDTTMIFETLKRANKTVCYPKVLDTRKMSFYKVCSLNELKPCFVGIPEPEIDKTKYIEPEEIDLIVVPGVAFDTKCRRIGYGGGFYDTFLSSNTCNFVKVALCYEVQVFEEVVTNKHDIKMDVIVTEKRVIDCGGY